MQIDLNPEAMRDLVAKTLFDSIAPEARDDLIQKAIIHLMTPTPTYGRTPPETPIETAIKQAAFQVANTIARERLTADPEFQANLESMFADVTKKMFSPELREKMVTAICDAVVSGLRDR